MPLIISNLFYKIKKKKNYYYFKPLHIVIITFGILAMHPQALFVCSCLHDVINCLYLKEKVSIEMAFAACWCSLRFIYHSSFRSTMFTMSTICEMHTRVNIMDVYATTC